MGRARGDVGSDLRPPIDLPGCTLEVVYPASVYSLERHENFAYERFAHNVFRESVCALTDRHLPPRVTVSFVPTTIRYPAWFINCGVKHDTTPGSRVVVESPQMLPPLLLLFAHVVAPHLRDEARSPGSDHRAEIRDIILRFGDFASEAVRAFKSRGLASAVRAAHDISSLDLPAIEDCADDFDMLSYLIANHEVAHIYVEQLTNQPGSPHEDSRAFEYLADLVAAEWMFRRYILLTPDRPAYREQRGFESHAEALAANSRHVICSLFSLLVFMGVAGAQRSGGRFSFKGGIQHPGAYGRCWLQMEWILVAIETHIAGEFGEDWMQGVLECWKRAQDRIIEAGLVSRSALWQVAEKLEVEAVQRAAQIAEERGIGEILTRPHFFSGRVEIATRTRGRVDA